eukprot:GILI01017253.1.p1 GENE.GILI01017253.1~~GILI01017253.1.p1  ORF type:complete len:344 (-),score=86.46 GILI01017253.1:226-1257(-)
MSLLIRLTSRAAQAQRGALRTQLPRTSLRYLSTKASEEPPQEEQKSASGLSSLFSRFREKIDEVFPDQNFQYTKYDKKPTLTSAILRKQAEETMKQQYGASGVPPDFDPMSNPANTTAVVLVNKKETAWERVGSKLRDMPLLNSLFGIKDAEVVQRAREEWETTQNPWLLRLRDLSDRVFGESEMAMALREMKENDPSFNLNNFLREVEFKIAPMAVRAFLEADLPLLQKICGEGAYAVFAANVKDRQSQGLWMDPNILDFGELELKVAKVQDKGAPLFVFTFATQQINCLRDSKGEIVDGKIDDIRKVHYALALTRHSSPAIEVGHVWEVSEMGIIYQMDTI